MCNSYPIRNPKFGTLVLSLLLLSATVYAQIGNFPVLLGDYEQLATDSNRINEKLAYATKEQPLNSDTALTVLLQAYRESEYLQFKNGIVKSLSHLGKAYLNKGLYDTAIAYFDLVISKAKKWNIKDYIHRYYFNIGSCYFYKAQYHQTLKYYYEGLKNAQKYHLHIPQLDSFNIYMNIAMAWDRLNNKKEVLAHFNLAHGIAERNGDPELLGTYYNLKAGFYKQDWKVAIQYRHKALALQRNPANRISTFNNIAHTYIEQAKVDSSHFYILKAQGLITKNPQLMEFDKLHMIDNWGHYFILKKEYHKAQKILLEVYQTSQKTGTIDMILHIAPNLAKSYLATKNYQKAYQYLDIYSQMKDSIFENQKSQLLNDWLEIKGKESNQIVREQQLRISLQQSQLNSRNLWISMTTACLIFLCTFFLWLNRSYKQRNKLQNTIIKNMEQEQEINQLKASVRGEEQERKRIGKELHDGIASELWAIKMNIADMRSQVQHRQISYQDLEMVHQQLVSAANEIRNTAHNLIPEQLENGLIEAVGILCKKLSYQTKLEIDFQQYGFIAPLNPEIELSLYRMIQELINNCLKHADCASYLLVQISYSAKMLNITVEDNGKGFDHYDEHTRDNHVLHTVRQRVQTLKGLLDIKSIKGLGSTVYLEFDFNNLV